MHPHIIIDGAPRWNPEYDYAGTKIQPYSFINGTDIITVDYSQCANEMASYMAIAVDSMNACETMSATGGFCCRMECDNLPTVKIKYVGRWKGLTIELCAECYKIVKNIPLDTWKGHVVSVCTRENMCYLRHSTSECPFIMQIVPLSIHWWPHGKLFCYHGDQCQCAELAREVFINVMVPKYWSLLQAFADCKDVVLIIVGKLCHGCGA